MSYKTPKVKLETLNSFNPDWFGILSTKASFRVMNKIAIVDFHSNYYNQLNTIELTKVSPTNSCGFAKFSGKVYVKKCDKDVEFDIYSIKLNEIFSSTFIAISNPYYPYYFGMINIPSGRNVKLSAKQKIELLPCFSVSSGATFNAEIKGCTTN